MRRLSIAALTSLALLLSHAQAQETSDIVDYGDSSGTVTAEAFTVEIKKAGSRCELTGYDEAAHGFFKNLDGHGKDAVVRMRKFLKSLGYLK